MRVKQAEWTRPIGRACVAVWLLAVAGPARANPSQADVFRSIQNNVGSKDTVSGTTMLGLLAAAVGVVIVAVVANSWQDRPGVRGGGGRRAATGGRAGDVPRGMAKPGDGAGGGRWAGPWGRRAEPLDHPGKLLRELMAEAGLTRAQVRQLESLNARLAADDRGVEHLATLLLCPSLIRAAQGPPPAVGTRDRAIESAMRPYI